MAITRYCYHCGRSHPEAEMQQIATRNGKRWRCTRTIQASKKTTEERDRFGKMVSAVNAEISAVAKRRRACFEF